jgi:hypothetical protein
MAKIRLGFVSNSSSSSFTVFTRPEMTDDDLEKILLKDVDNCGVFAPMVKRIMRMCVEKITDAQTSLQKYGEDEFFYNEYFLKRAKDKGMTKVYDGRFASDNGDEIETLLCRYFAFNYEDDNFLIYKHDGQN